MQVFWIVALFVLGCIVGSFVNVCIYRLPRDKSPWRPSRSYCPHCHEGIAWYDNVPLLSYFLLGGQCRRCGSLISMRYVAVEFLTGVMFALTYAVTADRLEPLPVTAVYMVLTAVLIMASFMDMELRIIPNTVTIGAMFAAPVLSVLVPDLHYNSAFGRHYLVSLNDHVYGPLAACVVGMGVGAFITWGAGALGKMLFHREAMGLGDVKFMAALGGLLGWQQVVMIFFMAACLGAVIGIIHLLRTRDHHIPFGPYLSAAAIGAMLWGDRVLAAIGL